VVPADDATDNLVAPPPDVQALPGDALFSATQLVSKQTAAYAAREAKAGNVRVQAGERVDGKREIAVQVSKKSLPLSLRANPPQHLERYVKRRRRTASAWKRYFIYHGTPCPPDCPACMLADKHYGTPFRFRLTLTFALGMASEVDRFLLALSPPAFYLCHFEESRGDGQYHCHILIGGIYRPWLRARWPWRTMLSLPFAPAAGAGALDGERARAGGVRAAASASRRRHAPAAGSAGAHRFGAGPRPPGGA